MHSDAEEQVSEHVGKYLSDTVVHGRHLLLMTFCCLLKLPDLLQHHDRHGIHPGAGPNSASWCMAKEMLEQMLV